MASTSSSSVEKSFKYDVFLSFSGEDTNFVDNLYDALKKTRINTCKSSEIFKRPKNISDELIRSIEDSRYHVIVLCKNYASSTWSLHEMVKIMECQNTTTEQTVYPIFYDVERTEVRSQSGAFGEAFAIHEHEEADERWRYALKQVADLVGWEWKTTIDGHEAKLIQEIVEEIYLKPHFINRSIGEEDSDVKLTVGLETRVKDILSFLEIGSDDVRMIGISGMGGCGKTTLAWVVFEHISIWFEGKSFVENVREGSQSLGLRKMQKKILSDALNDESIDVTSVYEGQNMMKKMMGRRKVLVVLDEVYDKYHLEALAGETTWFKPGSRIIITTSDQQVLYQHRVDLIYDLRMLSHEEAACLFCLHAFGSEVPIQGYEKLVLEFIRCAEGHPLMIRMLGSFLWGRNKIEWYGFLKNLKLSSWRLVAEFWKQSYDSLDDDIQETFLDIACILKCKMKDEAIKILESCGRLDPQIGLRVLMQKSLISVSDTSCLRLHSLYRELGKYIVRSSHPNEPKRHSRLWIKEEIEDILLNECGTSETRSIRLEGSDLPPAIIMKGLRVIKRLQFLYVDNGDRCPSEKENGDSNWKIDDASLYLPNALKFLYWRHYPFTCLPKTFEADMLVNLEMTGSKISQLWEGGERKVLQNLRFLNLSSSPLSSLDLGMTPNLEELYLRECNDLEELYVPVELSKLKSLVLGCPKITNLNLEPIPNLEELCLEECNDSIELHLSVKPPKLILSAKQIKHLPNSICMLKHLKHLQLKSCLQLEQLPHDLDAFECLEELYLTDCISLRDIPSSIGKIKCLKRLHVIYCILIRKLPGELGLLNCLQELNIEGSGVRDLPHSILELKGLLLVGSRGLLESYGLTSLVEISSYTASCYI